KVLTSVDNNGNAIWKKPGCGDNQEGFESGTGPWNDGGGDDPWETNSGGTTSGSTGPTAANEGTSYAYCETSGTAAGDVFIFQSEMTTCNDPSITFDYHMYFNGSTDGTLNLDVSTDGGTTWNNLWNMTGDQGTAWQNDETVNLGAYADQGILIRFHFTVGTGTSYQYDCALDDINLIDIDVNAGSFAATDDDWERVGPNFVRTMYEDDSVLVGTTGNGPTFPYEFAVDNGLASGTNTGIGSIEYFTDEASETTINNRFSSAEDAIHDLGSTTQRWDEVFAANGVINTSDRRDKKDIENLNYGLAEVMQLKPVSFNWKDQLNSPDKAGVKKLGLIAQDLYEVIPEVVKTKDYVKIGEDPDTEEPIREVQEAKRWGVYYSDLIPVLVKGIQEQQEIIENQNTKIESLESRIERLEALIENKE
ncbi:MAG: tail fiber domain-containing protein, partial [Brumimicrobium sp.]